MRDIRTFCRYIGDESITKEKVLLYKEHLIKRGYAFTSINSMLASINSLFSFLEWNHCKVKGIRTQRKIYCSEDKELTKAEYMRLLKAAEKYVQLSLIMQTICSTGIRISELQYFTVEAIRSGQVNVKCKNKLRTVLIPNKLCIRLLNYIKQRGMKSGPIFITRTGHPMDRSNIWTNMKKLCSEAQVKASKVFPHNLRKLFARTFYEIEKDIAKLADILGHGSIETTRIYIMTTSQEHRKRIERLGLVQ